jgi:hypothetical protein
LTRFQVSLEKLEAYTGTTFHSKLDRSKVSYFEIGASCLLTQIVCWFNH